LILGRNEKICQETGNLSNNNSDRSGTDTNLMILDKNSISEFDLHEINTQKSA